MAPRAVIFDFDGVLVDSERYWQIEEDSFFRGLLKGWDGAHHPDIVGLSVDGSFRYFQRTYGIAISLDAYKAAYADIAERVYAQCSVLPGIPALLQNLVDAAIPLAIASSAPKRQIEQVTGRCKMRQHFHCIVSAEDLPPDEGKPKPTVYLTAADQLGMPAQKCIAVEDARNGVLSAKAAGMKCIGIRNGVNDAQDLSQADLLIESFPGLTIEDIQRL